ncbi:MAG: DciA family protein [Rhizobiaceae bacterium]
MAGNTGTRSTGKGGGPKPVSELAVRVLEPVISRRTGMTMDLISAWPAIVGEPWDGFTLPEKINWPRRANDNDPFEPATLVVACDGSGAILFQHSLSEVMEKVNTFFGFSAIARIRIVQKPVRPRRATGKRELPTLDAAQRKRLDRIISTVEDEGLRTRLEKLGRGVLGKGLR